MGADISRVRFNPLKDYSGVLLQQGRLLLDADFNDQVALQERRLRAETVDLTSLGPTPGQAGVAWVPRHTPDAFEISKSGNDLSIGRGRMYVDGLLAENHGTEFKGFNPLLSEPAGTKDAAYTSQPYWTTPDPLPTKGKHLAYLDVWRREVTHLEAPRLVEIAVGVDATARWQTVWEVRLLQDVGSIDCSADDADIPGWSDVIQPSAGRLTTDTIQVDPATDPCDLPPTGGYRGRENQTYRIEIHEGGPPGTATFKWSRDNGSVAFPVVEVVSATVLRLASIGRDEVLRISTGDWVEILDDHDEFGQRPGAMRKVTVDDAARTITFVGGLPVDIAQADVNEVAARHLRVRRWDQSGVVRDATGATYTNLNAASSTGVILTPAAGSTQIVLEHGIVVSFSVAPGGSGKFRSGDHWIAAARTSDTSIEALDAAPPLGIHHHYARLAVLDLDTSDVGDCREVWPRADETCCSVTVGDGTTSVGQFREIQDAIDYVTEIGGGRVCLLPGVFELRASVAIRTDDLIVSGCEAMSQVVAGEFPAFMIEGTQRVTLESLFATSRARQGTVVIRGSSDVDVADCAVRNGAGFVWSYRRKAGGTTAGPAPVPGAAMQQPEGPAITTQELDGRPSARFRVVECQLVGLPAVSFQGESGALDRSRLSGGGAWISDGSEDIRLTDNEISNGMGPGVLLGGLLPDEKPSAKILGLARITIADNRIHAMSGSGIASWLAPDDKDPMFSRRSGTPSRIDTLVVDRNEILGCARDPATGFVDPMATGGVVLRAVLALTIRNNEIADNGTRSRDGACGVFLYGCRAVEIESNRIHGNGPPEVGPNDGGVGRFQGGIVAPMVVAEMQQMTLPASRVPRWVARGPAARIHDNTVIAPRGQALLLIALGPVSVADNLLASHDVADQSATALLSRFGHCVLIVDLGTTFELAGVGMLQAVARDALPIDGRLSVTGNQIEFAYTQREVRPSGAAVGLLSNDDVALHDNQVVNHGD